MVATKSAGSRRLAVGPDTGMVSVEVENQSVEDGGLREKAANPVSNLELVRKLQDPKAPRSRFVSMTRILH